MNRATRRAPEIAAALDRLPARLRERLACDWLIGSCPVFVGLHEYSNTDDGRSYSDTAHVAFGYHQRRPRDDQAPTVVLPVPETPMIIVHELGHVLDAAIGFRRHTPQPVSWYARRNDREAFAEAFTLCAVPDLCAEWGDHYDGATLAQDAETLALFAELARS